MATSTQVGDFLDIQLTGNIIHSHWFKTIQKSGKADLLAINILAEIVYWYKPIEVRNEITGEHIGWKKKYKADALQKSYDAFAEQFGVTKRQVRDAVARLEEVGVIRRDFRTITQGSMTMNNVLFIHLDIEKLKELSYPSNENMQDLLPNDVPPMTKKCNTYNEKTSDLLPKNVTPPTSKRKTNTKITTEITTESGKDSHAPRKIKYGDFVKLSEKEYEKLCNDFGQAIIFEYIEKLNNYIGSKGKRYKSHYHTIRNWLSRDKIKPKDLEQRERENNAQHRLNEEIEEMKEILGLG